MSICLLRNKHVVFCDPFLWTSPAHPTVSRESCCWRCPSASSTSLVMRRESGGLGFVLKDLHGFRGSFRVNNMYNRNLLWDHKSWTGHVAPKLTEPTRRQGSIPVRDRITKTAAWQPKNNIPTKNTCYRNHTKFHKIHINPRLNHKTPHGFFRYRWHVSTRSARKDVPMFLPWQLKGLGQLSYVKGHFGGDRGFVLGVAELTWRLFWPTENDTSKQGKINEMYWYQYLMYVF